MNIHIIEVCIDVVILMLFSFKTLNPLPVMLVYYFFDFLFTFIRIPLQYSKMLWNDKRFKGTYVTAEVLYHDEMQGSRWTTRVTVINYVMNGRSIDVLIDGTVGEPGEKIEVITDGEFASLAKPNRRDVFNNVKQMISFWVVSGILFFVFLKYINVYSIIVWILWEICKTVMLPYTWRGKIRGLKEQAGWHENV